MYNTVLALFLLVAVSLIALIMIQQNKGNDFGNSFSSWAILSVFGSHGGNMISHITAIFATLFFFLSLLLGNISSDIG